MTRLLKCPWATMKVNESKMPASKMTGLVIGWRCLVESPSKIAMDRPIVSNGLSVGDSMSFNTSGDPHAD